MVARAAALVSAWLLVVLTALPFTAPFASCELAALMASTAPAPSGAIHDLGHVASMGEAPSSSGTLSFLDEQEFKGAARASEVVSFHELTTRARLARTSTRGSAPHLPLFALRV